MTLERADGFISETLRWETNDDRTGGYTNDPSDSGGETKWGISKKAHPNLDIKSLTYKQAVEIYKKEYYSPYLNLIISENIAFKVFDLGILTGVKTSVKILQSVIIDKGRFTIRRDGILGPLTLTALHMTVAKIGEKAFLDELIKRHLNRMDMIIVLKPWAKKYKKGWTRRFVFLFKDPNIREGDTNYED